MALFVTISQSSAFQSCLSLVSSRMLSIDLAHILVSLLSLFTGAYFGFRLGRHIGHNHVLKCGLAVKNPELWELLHFLVIDQEEKSVTKKPRKPS